jgi:hypothetical protein
MPLTCRDAVRPLFGQDDHSVHIPDLDVGPSAQDKVVGNYRLERAGMILVADLRFVDLRVLGLSARE